MVKPILKKLHSSPKNSLDLDRGWEDQTIDLGYGAHSPYETGRSSFTMSRSATTRDVGFGFNSWDQGYGSGAGSAGGSGTATPTGAGVAMGGLDASTASVVIGGGARSVNRSRYHHARSTSATSHVSIATNGSNHRPGASFVHPFQQTPRTNTPPLAYANSFTSFERENNPARDYSPTIITENDDDDFDNQGSSSLSQSLTSHLHKPQPSNSHSTTSLRRPSLGSQRTSSLGDIRTHANGNASASANTVSSNSSQNPAPPLRINTNPSFARSVPTQSSRLAHGALNTSYSHSDLQLNQSPGDSPRPSINLSPSTSQAPMSPLRTSLEGAFRLRSRSEVDTGGRREDIREARRKFEEAERIKQEKYESEQRKKLERKQEKRKNTGGSDMSSNLGRPSFSRKRTPPVTGSHARRVRSGDSAGRTGVINEKVEGDDGPAFIGSNYASTEGGATPSFGPDVHDVRFETPRRSTTTKRRTQSYWTSFMLWLRTRLFKLGRR